LDYFCNILTWKYIDHLKNFEPQHEGDITQNFWYHMLWSYMLWKISVKIIAIWTLSCLTIICASRCLCFCKNEKNQISWLSSCIWKAIWLRKLKRELDAVYENFAPSFVTVNLNQSSWYNQLDWWWAFEKANNCDHHRNIEKVHQMILDRLIKVREKLWAHQKNVFLIYWLKN